MVILGKVYLSIMGLAFIGAAIVFVYRRIAFYMNSIPAVGRIIAVEEKPSVRRGYFYPKIEYTDKTGEATAFIDGIGNSSRDESLVGREINIRYRPGAEKPKAELRSFPALPPATFLFMGGGFPFCRLPDQITSLAGNGTRPQAFPPRSSRFSAR